MPNVNIRRCTIEDAELLADLAARTFTETFAADNTPENMRVYVESSFTVKKQATELSDPNSVIKIAELDGLAVGYSMLCAGNVPPNVTGEKPIELVRLYVTKESIGSGVGAALMKDCLLEAALRSYDTIWLGVWEHNQRAREFYRKWNFVDVGTHIFQLGDDAQTDFLMQRPTLSV